MTALLACAWTIAGAAYLLTNAHIGRLDERIAPPMRARPAGGPHGGGIFESLDLRFFRHVNPVPRVPGYLAGCRIAGETPNGFLVITNAIAALTFLGASAALLFGPF